MRYFVIDGHPAPGRLSERLLDTYVAALPDTAKVTRIAVRDQTFDPILHEGYATWQDWEPDLHAAAIAINSADHLVIAFPLWWGGTPALLKGFVDRLLRPHFAFRYREKGQLWDRLLGGRSADVLITLDTPPWFLRLFYGNAVVNQWKKQILEYSGIKPVRVHLFGPTRLGNAERQLVKWEARARSIAQGSSHLVPGKRIEPLADFLAYRNA